MGDRLITTVEGNATELVRRINNTGNSSVEDEQELCAIIDEAIKICESLTDKDKKFAELTDETVGAVFCVLSKVGREKARKKLMDAARKFRMATEVNNFLKTVLAEHLAQRDTLQRSTAFTGLPQGIENLLCGDYIADDTGIYSTVMKKGIEQRELICFHPILVTACYEVAGTTDVRVRLHYRPHGAWKSVVVPRRTVRDNRAILDLADCGVDVTSEHAGKLVDYLAALEGLNKDVLLPQTSVECLGFIRDADGNKQFSPYLDNVAFTGEKAFKQIFESVQQHGNAEQWIGIARGIRRRGGIGRMVLAASFAAPIVGYTNDLPFLIHIWGGSGIGKTVALTLAASVWGNPGMGNLVRSFDSTSVGQEVLAGFLRHIPLTLDELQTRDTRNEDFAQMVYLLCEGQGRTRGRADGGLRDTLTWRNTIITTGEQPILQNLSRGGAKNRVISLHADRPVFNDPATVIHTVNDNYGYAGKLVVTALLKKDEQEVRAAVDAAFKDLEQCAADGDERTQKQLRAGALLLVADRLADSAIFHDGDEWDAMEVVQHLAKVSEVDDFTRNWDWLQDWISRNRVRFSNDYNGDSFGFIRDGHICINSSLLNIELQKANIDPTGFIRTAAKDDLIQRSQDGRNAIQIRHGGIKARYIVLTAQCEDDTETETFDAFLG